MSNTEFREWAPLLDLFNKLPQKVQHGLFMFDVKLTCVDVVPEFLALGTNFGLVYWYDRCKKSLEKLRCENSNTAISSVKIISTVDYMVACGNLKGNISIFQIPKSPPDCLPDNLKPKNKQIERYTVTDLHDSPITALEWSKNGMKLFSGDRNGHIVFTEIDFYMHLCKSVEIINESYEVVQLSYLQQTLLVSTTFRTIICKKEDKWKVSQVGKKDRKVLGNFGGIFVQNSLRPTDLDIYCSRPGLRIWVSDLQGNVQKTLLFKDIVTRECHEICILNPVSIGAKHLNPQKEVAFGPLIVLKDEFLVTYNNDVVYIINPKQLAVSATISNLRRVIDVAVFKNEIFILEGERSLIRVSNVPEVIKDNTFAPPLASTFLPIASSIKDLTQKIQSNSIISAIPPLIENAFNGDLIIHTDNTSVIKAEEATESPRRNSLLPSVIPNETTPDSNEKLVLYNKISMQDFDDTILYKHRRRKRRQDMSGSIASWSSNSSEEKDVNVNISKPTVMEVSSVGILPDLRSPQTIENDIENKEKMLADILCLDKVKFSSEEMEKKLIDNEASNEEATFPRENVETEISSDESKEFMPWPNLLDIREKKGAEDLGNVEEKSLVNPSKIEQNCNRSPRVSKTPKKRSSAASTMEYGPTISNSLSFITEIPGCKNIPFDWQLKDINLLETVQNVDENPLELSTEWEIV